MMQYALAFLAAAVIAILAFLGGALSPSGAFATVFVGTITFGWGGLTPATLLIVFFVTSSGLSRFRRRYKSDLSPGFSKGGRRDYGQVLANGFVPAMSAFLFGMLGSDIWLAGVVGALATVTADTWGTELGVLSERTPRLITTGAKVPPGTSGGVTIPGTTAGMAGASLIGFIGAWMEGDMRWLLVGLVAGTVGMLIDSVLGATVQVMYSCPHCEVSTEQHPVHRCGTPTQPIRGISWINNDIVNWTASMCGAIMAMALWSLSASN